jgi:hypothetical protein
VDLLSHLPLHEQVTRMEQLWMVLIRPTGIWNITYQTAAAAQQAFELLSARVRAGRQHLHVQREGRSFEQFVQQADVSHMLHTDEMELAVKAAKEEGAKRGLTRRKETYATWVGQLSRLIADANGAAIRLESLPVQSVHSTLRRAFFDYEIYDENITILRHPFERSLSNRAIVTFSSRAAAQSAAILAARAPILSTLSPPPPHRPTSCALLE